MWVPAYCPLGQRHREDVARGRGKAYVQIDKTLNSSGTPNLACVDAKRPQKDSRLGLTVVKVVRETELLSSPAMYSDKLF